MEGYRLRNSHGDTIDPRQPLPVIEAKSGVLTSVSPTLTYSGKDAAGAVTTASLLYKPMYEAQGSRVASYWGNKENLVYSAFADGNPKKATSWLASVTETNGSAACTIYDPDKNLENLFESLTTTVKRFIVKVYDKSGNSLYGWIMGVSVSSDVYTFSVYNARVAETQNWVGTLASFDNTQLDHVEIYFYGSSLSFGTGTCLTEEVVCPKEFSKTRESQLLFAESLSNGQFFVDYERGDIIGKKADGTDTEVVTYNVLNTQNTSAVATTVYPAGLGLAGCGELQGTASALQNPTLACKMVKYKASAANAGNVYLGGAGVTKPDATTDATTGMQLAAGDDSGWLPVSNTNLFYRICDNATDALTFIALT